MLSLLTEFPQRAIKTRLIFCTQASELLRDVTLGANMRVHLVHMIILSEPDVRTFLHRGTFSPSKWI